MKAKKSNLFLVKDHHSFDEEGIEFKTKMLAWPILYQNKEDINQKYQKVIKEALVAMTQLSPFSAKISLGVDEKKKQLFDIHRIWGRIYLGDKVILYFSHDTRHDNAPFVSLFDWVEMMNFASSPEYEGHDAEFQKVIDWSSRENWKEFFLERLEQKHRTIMENVLITMEEATKNALLAVNIRDNLKKII